MELDHVLDLLPEKGKTTKIAWDLKEQLKYMVQILEMSALAGWIQKSPEGPLNLPEPPGNFRDWENMPNRMGSQGTAQLHGSDH